MNALQISKVVAEMSKIESELLLIDEDLYSINAEIDMLVTTEDNEEYILLKQEYDEIVLEQTELNNRLLILEKQLDNYESIEDDDR